MPHQPYLVGKRVNIVKCHGNAHDPNDVGCVCSLVGTTQKISRRYKSMFVGTPSYWLKGLKKRVQRREVEIHPDDVNKKRVRNPAGLHKPVGDLNGVFEEQFQKLLRETKFIVTDGSSFDIWREWHNRLKFEQIMVGLSTHYADLGGKECWASYWFYRIEGVMTMFVDACGSYQDYNALEKAAFKVAGMRPNPNNHVNGQNFHNHIAWHKMPWKKRKQRLMQDALVKFTEAQSELSRLSKE